MKLRSLFALVEDAQDLLEYFDKVETVDQMVSALERAKKRENAAQLLSDVASMRLAVEGLLEDMLEVGGSGVSDGDIPEDLLDGLGDEDAAENPAGESEEEPSPEPAVAGSKS